MLLFVARYELDVAEIARRAKSIQEVAKTATSKTR